MRNIFFVLFFLLHLDYACALDINQTWTEEVYLEKNQIPYSVFSIQLKIDANNKVDGELCSIVNYGNKIDCPILFSSKLINNEIKVHFVSTFGGKNGTAVIKLQESNLVWNLITNPNGEYYFAKKATLLPDKIENY
jgi:hypothetical protein